MINSDRIPFSLSVAYFFFILRSEYSSVVNNESKEFIIFRSNARINLFDRIVVWFPSIFVWSLWSRKSSKECQIHWSRRHILETKNNKSVLLTDLISTSMSTVINIDIDIFYCTTKFFFLVLYDVFDRLDNEIQWWTPDDVSLIQIVWDQISLM